MTDAIPIRSLARPLWLAAATLMAADAVTTYIGLSLARPGDTVREINPFMAAMFDTFGVTGTLAAKAVIGVLCAWRLARIVDRGHRNTWANRSWWKPWKTVPLWKVQRGAVAALVFTVVVMGVVAGNNLASIRTLAAR